MRQLFAVMAFSSVMIASPSFAALSDFASSQSWATCVGTSTRLDVFVNEADLQDTAPRGPELNVGYEGLYVLTSDRGASAAGAKVTFSRTFVQIKSKYTSNIPVQIPVGKNVRAIIFGQEMTCSTSSDI